LTHFATSCLQERHYTPVSRGAYRNCSLDMFSYDYSYNNDDNNKIIIMSLLWVLYYIAVKQAVNYITLYNLK
jgi:hypothetical protein